MFGRILSMLLIVGGLNVAGYSGWNWWQEANLVKEYNGNRYAVSNDKSNPRKPIAKGIQYKKKIPRGESVGDLIIPRLKVRVPLVEGIGDPQLKKGVGHYPGKDLVFPGETGHAVLAGHRETTFKRMGEIKQGDSLVVTNQEGTFIYAVRKMWITKANDRKVIVSRNKPILTLITCYPFEAIGNAPERYIVEADLVKIENVTG